MARTVDDSERINVIESTTVDSTSHDNPTLKIQIPKLEEVSFNFESESEVIVIGILIWFCQTELSFLGF